MDYIRTIAGYHRIVRSWFLSREKNSSYSVLNSTVDETEMSKSLPSGLSKHTTSCSKERGKSTRNRTADSFCVNIPKVSTRWYKSWDRDCSFMLLAMCTHAAGYEFVRVGSLTLFTSYFGAEKLPYMLTFVPFMAVVLILIYNEMLGRLGAAKTLQMSNLYCAGVVLLLLICIHLQVYLFICVPLLYIFREAYASFLSSQYWSFFNSRFNSKEAETLFGPIVGIVSLFAMSACVFVQYVAVYVSTTCLVWFAIICLYSSSVLGKKAYAISTVKPKDFAVSPPKSEHKNSNSCNKLLSGHRSLQIHPMLTPLFIATVAMQVTATVLGLSYNNYLRAELPLDADRSVYTGKVYAIIKGFSAFVQLFGVSYLVKRIPVVSLIFMQPVIMACSIMVSIIYPCLTTACVAMVSFKISEHSIFSTCKELLFVPMGKEAKFVAKEYIDVVGYRLGKGGVSAILSILLGIFTVTPFGYSCLSLLALLLWGYSTLLLLRRSKLSNRSTPADTLPI